MSESRSRQAGAPLFARRRKLLKSSMYAGVLALGQFGLAGVSRAADGLIALVHTQAAGDNGPIDSMIASLKKLAAEKGLRTRIIYAQDPSAYEAIFKNLGDAGAAIVVTTFNEVAGPLKAVAPRYPKTKFIQLFADPFQPSLANVVTVSYAYYLGCYLSGLFGAQISKSGKLGFVGGASFPPINADFHAMQAGAAAAGRPNVSVAGAFAGSFQDPAKGQAIATQMYASQIDYIQTDAGATDVGIIQAASERPGSLVSGVSVSQYKLAPRAIPAIVELNFGLSLYQQVSRAMQANWAGGHVSAGLDSGVVSFQLSNVFLSQGDADRVAAAKRIWPQIEKARADIISGTLKVPFSPAL